MGILLVFSIGGQPVRAFGKETPFLPDRVPVGTVPARLDVFGGSAPRCSLPPQEDNRASRPFSGPIKSLRFVFRTGKTAPVLSLAQRYADDIDFRILALLGMTGTLPDFLSPGRDNGSKIFAFMKKEG